MTAAATSGRMFTTAEVEWFVLAAYRVYREEGRSALVAAALAETQMFGQVLLEARENALQCALWEQRRLYASDLLKRVHARRRSGPLHWVRPSR